MAKTTNFRPITVDEVKAHQYKPDLDQAQLRQVVVTDYTSTIGNSNSDLLFQENDFNLEVSQSFESTRVTWIPVPKGTTKEQVQSLLNSKRDARIYRIISHNVMDCLSEEQKMGMELDYSTLEDYKTKLEIKDRHGNPIDGPTQYSQNFFSVSGKEDIDLRDKEVVREMTPTQEARDESGIAA